MKSHPDFLTVFEIYQKIHSQGYQVFLAGGCVRDGLLGLTPNDFDLATNATPDQIIGLFEKTVSVGKAYGVIIVIEAGIEVEVTTFRSDGIYEDGRRPAAVEFSSPEMDAERRDFTINALFYDLANDQVLDYVEGVTDLNQRLLRAVGEPAKRFREDHLRMLRAVRFVGQLAFELESATRQAIVENVRQIMTVSRERIHAEVQKLLLSQNQIRGLQEFQALGFSEILFPAQPFNLPLWQEVWQKQRKNLSLVDDGRLFKEKSILLNWFIFWNVIWTPALASEFEKVLSEWKFSNQEKQNLLKMLFWRGQTKTFEKKSLGELVEICFDQNQLLALNIYAQQKILDEKKTILVKNQFLKFKGQKPEAILKAKDLPKEIQGPEIGRILRLCYWAQLESKISNLEQARAFLKAQVKSS